MSDLLESHAHPVRPDVPDRLSQAVSLAIDSQAVSLAIDSWVVSLVIDSRASGLKSVFFIVKSIFDIVKTTEKVREKSGKNQRKIREKFMGILGEVGKVFSRAVF